MQLSRGISIAVCYISPCWTVASQWAPQAPLVGQKDEVRAKVLDGMDSHPSQSLSDEDAFITALDSSNYNMSTEYFNHNADLSSLASRLVFDEGQCDTEQRIKIYSGWQQTWRLMNVMHAVADAGIHWNWYAVLQFLGPNGGGHSSDMQERFTSRPIYYPIPPSRVDNSRVVPR